MTKCQAHNKKLLVRLLFEKVEDLDGMVPYEIANKSNFEAFFCVDAIQDMVIKIWAEKIENHWKFKHVSVSSS